MREKRALIKASEELKCDDMLTITWNYEAEEEFNGKQIKSIPLWKWLFEILFILSDIPVSFYSRGGLALFLDALTKQQILPYSPRL